MNRHDRPAPARRTRKRHRSRAGLLLAMAALAGPEIALPGTAEAARTAAFTAADTGARITAETVLGPNERDITIDSPSLGTSVKARILLPEDWEAETARTWPVLYAFHGGQDDYTSWPRNSDIEQWAADYSAIVVMPEAANGGYTDWYNYGRGGTPKWETFHTREVVQLIERNYHASGVRAAIGDSSGGQGAISYAARHPGMFRHVASLSGVLWLRSPGMPSMIMMTNLRNGLDPIAMYGFIFLNADIWRAHDPYELAPRLRGTKLFFSSGGVGEADPGGSGDNLVGVYSERAVGETNVAFRERLDALGIPYTADLYPGGIHDWPSWVPIAERVWPDLMASIGASEL